MSNSIKHVYAVNRLSKLILENKIDDDYTADVGVFILENKEDLYFLAFQHKKNAQKVVMKFLKRNIGPFNSYIISKKLSEIGIPTEEKICTLSYSLMLLLYWLPILIIAWNYLSIGLFIGFFIVFLLIVPVFIVAAIAGILRYSCLFYFKESSKYKSHEYKSNFIKVD